MSRVAVIISKTMRVGVSSVLVLLSALLASQCELQNLDDLEKNSGSDASAGKCVQFVSCSGCVGCDALCACLAPKNLSQCLFSCTVDAGAGGGAGMTSGGGSGGIVAGGGSGGFAGGGGSGGTNDTGGGGLGGSVTGGTGGVGGTMVGGGGTGGTLVTGGGGTPASGGSGGSACDDCKQANCSQEIQACAADSACVYLGTCVDGCADSACVQQCIDQFSTGYLSYEAFVACTQQKCANECG